MLEPVLEPKRKEALPPFSPSAGPALPEIRVLLIEDNAVDSLWVRKEMDAYPDALFSVTPVSKLEQALAQLDSGFYDAILLDLNLPDSHGGETLLRTLMHSTKVPLVILTGNRDRHLSDNARERGVYAYLIKGLGGMPQLPRIVHDAVLQRRAQQAEGNDLEN